jgi:hypothetical protein
MLQRHNAQIANFDVASLRVKATAMIQDAAADAWLSKYAGLRFAMTNQAKSICAKVCVRNVFAMARVKMTRVETTARRGGSESRACELFLDDDVILSADLSLDQQVRVSAKESNLHQLSSRVISIDEPSGEIARYLLSFGVILPAINAHQLLRLLFLRLGPQS